MTVVAGRSVSKCGASVPATGTILALDTCFAACSVAIGTSPGTTEARVTSRFEAMATGQAERIIPLVAEIVAEAGITMSEIKTLAVTIGPGSFTGTRIGIAAAKGLALALGGEAAGVSSHGFTTLNVIARQVALSAARSHSPPASDSAGERLCIAIDIGRQETYAQVFSPDGSLPQTPAARLPLKEVAAFAANWEARVILDGPEFSPGDHNFSADFLPRAETLVALMTQSAAKTMIVEPLYLRAPDAKPKASI